MSRKFGGRCLSIVALTGFACSARDRPTVPPDTGVLAGVGGTDGGASFVGLGGQGTSSTGPFHDFPAAAVFDTNVPANADSLFGPAGSGDTTRGPCVLEPEPDTLIPRNWLRPRFRFATSTGENLFELRLHTDAEDHDLVVYTTATSWTMPGDIWTALASHAQNAPITFTVRGASFDGQKLASAPGVSASVVLTIAPSDANGSIVYWTTSDSTALKGFAAGTEQVQTVLVPQQVQMRTTQGSQVTCIGCHTSTPDGLYAAFTAQAPWGNVLASVKNDTTGNAPSFLGSGAQNVLRTVNPLGIQTFSPAHYRTGDRVLVAPHGEGPASQLLWLDLEATAESGAYGVIARTGDSRGVGAPTWSHDGQTIVYVSTNSEHAGRLDTGPADLYAVRYANRSGGTATPIPGASQQARDEYYPSFSPDDALIAFNGVPAGTRMYDAAPAEVFVIPRAGGSPTRLRANDPPTCANRPSPGITNSWPKWAPDTTTSGDRQYYWLIFSSKRGESGGPQLFITAIVTSPSGIETHGALYLWNQPLTENNHTPAWDYFQIPEPPPR